MKKILQIFDEPIKYGGEESIMSNMLSTLDLKNHYKVDLFTPYYIKNKNLINLIENNGGHVFSFDNKNDKNNLNEIKNFLKEKNDYDIYHINADTIKSIIRYSSLCKKYNKYAKVIAHTHNIEKKINLWQKFKRIFYKLKLEKNIDCILGDSKRILEDKFSKNLLKKIYILDNGVDVERLKYNENIRKEIREKYNIQNKFLIGHIGEYTKNKNQKFLIDVFFEVLKMNHNIVLMLIGSGILKQDIENYAKKLGIYDNIIFIDESEDVYKYYHAFDIFILPSIYERVGLVGIEAQIAGLPLLISKNITKDIYISNATVYLPLDNKNICVDLILKIKSNNNDEYNRKKFVIDYDKYDKNKTFKIIKDIYDNI